MRRSSKDEQILSEAKRLIANATERLQIKQQEVREIGIELAAHTAHYESLVKVLSPVPRNKPATATTAAKETATKEAKCGICGQVKDHPDHDRTYIKSHDFEAGKSVARRKARRKQESAQSIPSSETELEGVSSVAHAASAGD